MTKTKEIRLVDLTLLVRDMEQMTERLRAIPEGFVIDLNPEGVTLADALESIRHSALRLAAEVEATI